MIPTALPVRHGTIRGSKKIDLALQVVGCVRIGIRRKTCAKLQASSVKLEPNFLLEFK